MKHAPGSTKTFSPDLIEVVVGLYAYVVPDAHGRVVFAGFGGLLVEVLEVGVVLVLPVPHRRELSHARLPRQKHSLR